MRCVDSGTGPHENVVEGLPVALRVDGSGGGTVTTLCTSHKAFGARFPSFHLLVSFSTAPPVASRVACPSRPRSWDSYLISTLERCPSSKPVLTTYPVGYDLPHRIPAGETRPTLLVPVGFGPGDGILRQNGRLMRRKAREPIPSPLWASGFSFSRSALLNEVLVCRSVSRLVLGLIGVRVRQSGCDDGRNRRPSVV